MIISASRRTDIPAFYSPWLLNRLRAGMVLVRNPFNRRQVSEILLDPSVVDCLVLWSKNPAPLLPLVRDIECMGYPLVIQYTITGCDGVLEPGLPNLATRLETFKRCAELLGPDRVLWRFDPILLTKNCDHERVIHRFAEISAALSGLTRQCTISFVSLYAKCRRNLAGTELVTPDENSKKRLIFVLNTLAVDRGIRLKGCCDAFLTEHCALEQAHCIDAKQLSEILGYRLGAKKDPGQRPACGCSQSIDIGAYDSCPHGCRYCYANTSHRSAIKNNALHDPHSPLLSGQLQGDETIHRREMVSSQSIQPSLFQALVHNKA